MKTLLIIVAIGLSDFYFSQSSLNWAKCFTGGTYADIGQSITKDASGNVYTIGYFAGTVDFDPGPGTFNLITVGDVDAYVSKLDANGNFLWAKQIAGATGGFYPSAYQIGSSIAIDLVGNLYITGSFGGTADFNPGVGIFNMTSAGNFDAFVCKLDNNGNFIWAKQFGGPTPLLSNTFGDKGFSIATDNTGNVYTLGIFDGTVDFDPGPGVFNLTKSGSSFNDVFILKLDSFGNFLWAKQIGGVNDDMGYSISTDSFGNVYSIGLFKGTVDFDPSPSSFNMISSGGSSDIFVSKLDGLGNFLWAKRLGNNNDEIGSDLALDMDGNIYIIGSFAGTMDFDPSTTNFNMTSWSGSSDIFVSKLTADGDFLWAKPFGSTSNETPSSITLDNNGNLYITGSFGGTVDFDPGAAIFNMSSTGGQLFVSKLDSVGNFLFAKQLAASTSFNGKAIAVDALENILITGSFHGTVDFDPGFGIFNLTSADPTSPVDGDAFVWKLSPCAFTSSTVNVTACESYTMNNFSYNASSTYIQVLTNSSNCDSIITLNLSIVNPTTSTTTESVCDNYTWNGTTYNQSGQYTFITTNSNGCDSTAILNLTINQSTSTQTQTAIDSYTWPVNGITYTQSGTYSAVIPNSAGCDSTITLILTLQFTGIGENEATYLAVYPNPATSLVTIEGEGIENKEYTLVNIQGRVVLNGTFKTNKETLDLKTLARGQYLLRVEGKELKVVKE